MTADQMGVSALLGYRGALAINWPKHRTHHAACDCISTERLA